MAEAHVMPRDDLVLNEPDEDCPCGPYADFVEGGVVYIHSSLDARERNE